MIDVNAYLGHFAFRQLRHNTAAGLLRLMDTRKIERAVVSSAAAITYRNPQAGNEEVAAEAKLRPDRFVTFAVLNPTYAGWQDDLKICHEQFGMSGVRLYPGWHNYRLTDPLCRELVNAAASRGMAVSIPLRVEDRRQRSWLVDIPDVAMEDIAALVKACPQARFIIGNGTGFTGSALGRKNSGLPPNYAIEISLVAVAPHDEMTQLLANLGEDRILFGTGMPFHYPDPALVKMELLDASEGIKEKIRRRNAIRWLKLG
jgi:predicted TIM-barrel fold metal-dependent hydrolase